MIVHYTQALWRSKAFGIRTAILTVIITMMEQLGDQCLASGGPVKMVKGNQEAVDPPGHVGREKKL